MRLAHQPAHTQFQRRFCSPLKYRRTRLSESSVAGLRFRYDDGAPYVRGMGFGERLRTARKAKRLSGEALGKMLDPQVSKQSISHWEKGEHPPDVNQVQQLCAALGVSADDLILGTPTSFERLNGFEGQLVTLFRQIPPEARSQILRDLGSKAHEAIAQKADGQTPIESPEAASDPRVMSIPPRKPSHPRSVTNPMPRTGRPAPAETKPKKGAA